MSRWLLLVAVAWPVGLAAVVALCWAAGHRDDVLEVDEIDELVKVWASEGQTR